MRKKKAGPVSDSLIINFIFATFLLVLLLASITILAVPVVVYCLVKVIAYLCYGRKQKTFGIAGVDQLDGISFEKYVAGLLQKSGYKKVGTTRASGDYGVDIIAFKDGVKYAFQCKRYNSNLGVKSIQEIYSGAGMYHADVAVVVTNANFTANAVKLAHELGVLLWDRNQLIHLMNSIETRDNWVALKEWFSKWVVTLFGGR